MNTQADKSQDNKKQSVSAADSLKQSGTESAFQFVGNRPEALAQRKMQEMADNRPEVKQLRSIQAMANNSPQSKQDAQLRSMADNYSPSARARNNPEVGLSPMGYSTTIIQRMKDPSEMSVSERIAFFHASGGQQQQQTSGGGGATNIAAKSWAEQNESERLETLKLRLRTDIVNPLVEKISNDSLTLMEYLTGDTSTVFNEMVKQSGIEGTDEDNAIIVLDNKLTEKLKQLKIQQSEVKTDGDNDDDDDDVLGQQQQQSDNNDFELSLHRSVAWGNAAFENAKRIFKGACQCGYHWKEATVPGINEPVYRCQVPISENDLERDFQQAFSQKRAKWNQKEPWRDRTKERYAEIEAEIQKEVREENGDPRTPGTHIMSKDYKRGWELVGGTLSVVI